MTSIGGPTVRLLRFCGDSEKYMDYIIRAVDYGRMFEVKEAV